MNKTKMKEQMRIGEKVCSAQIIQVYHTLNTNLNKTNVRSLLAATSLEISNCIQIVYFSAGVTLTSDGWPWKTIGHFFYTTSSFVHHFKSISDFELELQSGNA